MAATGVARVDRIAQLAGLHRRGQELVEALPVQDVRTQYHPELSPLGWHLGHCAFIETYWLHEVVLGDNSVTATLHGVYFPDLCEKAARPELVLDRDRLLEWTRAVHRQNLALLADPPDRALEHTLMAGDYLLDFLIQHYAQHLETMHYVLVQRALDRDSRWLPEKKLLPAGVGREAIQLPTGNVTIGSSDICAYDNEQPQHETRLSGGLIARWPVTNAEYLAFMQDDGYRRRELWSTPGWEWLRSTDVDSPAVWRRSSDLWGEIGACGPRELEPRAPVGGLCFYEAEAFSRWVGARLPHEYEWEAAALIGQLQGSGQVWEWCANRFHPYPGFRAFPYDGYSTPWFDGRHGVLRGGSEYTLPQLRRVSFRNFYHLDKRHICAGMRLAWD